LILDLIQNEGLYDEDPMTVFVVDLWVRRLVEGEQSLAMEHTSHYIKHADDKVDQFLTTNDTIEALIN